MELVVETLHASGEDVEKAFADAAKAIWGDGPRQTLEEIDRIADETEAYGFTSLDLITAMASGVAVAMPGRSPRQRKPS